jgi:23S rRNA (adenine2503-C2)-methyltransferase
MTLDSAFSYLPEDWDAYAQTAGVPKFRGAQIKDWIFAKGALAPEELTNLPAALRQKLTEDLDWSLPQITSRLDSPDGASKLLLKGKKDQYYEAVILRYENRTSLCVSSQVGCKLACHFCQTGKLGFFRHLDAGEIIGQLVLANRILRDEGKRVTHVVFMGMGEPLDNFEPVVRACQIMVHPEAYGLSRRRVTVSTSGIVPQILPLAQRVPVRLAISLHGATDELRSSLMPINNKYPLGELKEALKNFQKTTQDPITVEYILIKGKNSGVKEAKDLVRFLHGLKTKVNLIPFNPHPGLPFERPDEEEILMFQSHLSQRGIPAPVRYSKGQAVSAACGQLAAKQGEDLGAAPLRKNVVGV